MAKTQLRLWTDMAMQIPDATLREQALASLAKKRFHSDGGSVYAAQNVHHTPQLVRLIVALQTISDYLDNLCDRCETFDETDFHQLHHAMRDAVNPDAELRPYYAMRGNPDDGGYLHQLVRACQQELRSFPGYEAAQPHVVWLTERYCELQEYKHIEPAQRESRLQDWAKHYADQFPQLQWWEFAAATGSTLGTFALFAASLQPLTEHRARQIWGAYFPWVCGLHIMLDYLIDLEEDMAEGDFNFVRCYPEVGQAYQRIGLFEQNGLNNVAAIADEGNIHRHVVKGLLAMYLSDRKALNQQLLRPTRRLIWTSGPTTWLFYGACWLYRLIR